MGVHGLWKLLEAAGKPVPLETLDNKVLAVDVSIWLHQMMKGFQDSRGSPVPNAHLLGLFHRVCKLLFYRIKPVFVFDGGVPLLKRQTIAARKKLKNQASQNAADAKQKLLKNLVKRKVVRQILQPPKTSDDNYVENKPEDDMFRLPPLPEEALNSESEDESMDRLQGFTKCDSSSESEPDIKPSSHLLCAKPDLHTLDVSSEEFLSLPPDVRHDILSDLKETRKQNSWGRLHEMPEESGEFSNFQLGRLLKRYNVQCAMEKAEKEMGGKVMRMNELQELMAAQGVDCIEDNPLVESASQRIASDSSTRFVLCKDTTQSLQSSQSTSSGMSTKENSLLDDQVEFIAQMAENMLQQMQKIKQEKLISGEGESLAVLGGTVDEADPIQMKNDANVTREKILVDTWSSDDETVKSTIDASVTREKILVDTWSSDDETVKSPQDFDEKTSKSAKMSPKRKLCDSMTDSISLMPPACKISKLDSKNDAQHVNFVPIEADSKNQYFGTSGSGTRDLPSCTPVIDTSREEGKVLDDREETIGSSSEDGEVAQQMRNPKQRTFTNKGYDSALQSNDETVDLTCTKAIGPSSEEKSLEIVIHPAKELEDDIFADIFQTSPELEGVSENFKNGSSLLSDKKTLEIVVNPNEKPVADDIFADIFNSQSQKLESVTNENEMSSEGEGEQEQDSNSIGDKQYLLQAKESESVQKSDESSISSIFLSIPSSSTDLTEMEASLEAEHVDLQKERGRQERLAASITDQMCTEAQELLQLFGLPYVVAPMEAEAQCAFLDVISLTEGSITDDSDIWLFGGKKVYKNFFNQKKHVLQFTSSNICHYFKLSREQLVQLALLVGSDYTTGIQGVGPVTALEIVAAFHSKAETDPVQCALSGLGQFRDWWNSGRPHKSNRLQFLDKKLKNLKFSEGFPSKAVVEAYLRPAVDDSQETFSWGALDLPALREYARMKFGWTASKTDEILLPVAKKWTSRSSQRSIDSYFNLRPQLVEGLGKMSKRVQKAVRILETETNSEDPDDPEPQSTTMIKEKSKRKRNSVSKKEATQNATVKKNRQDSFCSESGTKEHEITSEVQRGSKAKSLSKKTEELPIRAPTVARQRTSTGVKRVGMKSTQITDKVKAGTILTGATERYEEGVAKRDLKGPSESDHSDESNFVKQNLARDVQSRKKATGKARQLSRERKPTNANKICTAKNLQNAVDVQTSSDSDGDDPPLQRGQLPREPSAIRARGNSVEVNSERVVAHPGSSGMSSALNLPSTSQQSPGEGFDVADLEALSEMNWDDDPWVTGVEKRQPKIYFGGIRPNKPRKPAQSRPINPPENIDSRGVRPGWMTRERLESRTALVDAMHRKKEESIPQREQDHRALEDAKMKAIAVIKASEVKHASRLLGRQISKRGRGKPKPKGKILPEHNLSESSSDE